MYYVLYMYLYQACAAGCWASIGGGGALPSQKDLLPPIVYSVDSLVPGRLPGSLPADHVFGELSPAAFPVSSFRSGRNSLNWEIPKCLKSL